MGCGASAQLKVLKAELNQIRADKEKLQQENIEIKHRLAEQQTHLDHSEEYGRDLCNQLEIREDEIRGLSMKTLIMEEMLAAEQITVKLQTRRVEAMKYELLTKGGYSAAIYEDKHECKEENKLVEILTQTQNLNWSGSSTLVYNLAIDHMTERIENSSADLLAAFTARDKGGTKTLKSQSFKRALKDGCDELTPHECELLMLRFLGPDDITVSYLEFLNYFHWRYKKFKEEGMFRTTFSEAEMESAFQKLVNIYIEQREELTSALKKAGTSHSQTVISIQHFEVSLRLLLDTTELGDEDLMALSQMFREPDSTNVNSARILSQLKLASQEKADKEIATVLGVGKAVRKFKGLKAKKDAADEEEQRNQQEEREKESLRAEEEQRHQDEKKEMLLRIFQHNFYGKYDFFVEYFTKKDKKNQKHISKKAFLEGIRKACAELTEENEAILLDEFHNESTDSVLYENFLAMMMTRETAQKNVGKLKNTIKATKALQNAGKKGKTEREDAENKAGQEKEESLLELFQKYFEGKYDVLQECLELKDKKKSGMITKKTFIEIIEEICDDLQETELNFLADYFLRENNKVQYSDFLQRLKDCAKGDNSGKGIMFKVKQKVEVLQEIDDEADDIEEAWRPGIILTELNGLYQVKYDDGTSESDIIPARLRPVAPENPQEAAPKAQPTRRWFGCCGSADAVRKPEELIEEKTRGLDGGSKEDSVTKDGARNRQKEQKDQKDESDSESDCKSSSQNDDSVNTPAPKRNQKLKKSSSSQSDMSES